MCCAALRTLAGNPQQLGSSLMSSGLLSRLEQSPGPGSELLLLYLHSVGLETDRAAVSQDDGTGQTPGPYLKSRLWLCQLPVEAEQV